MSLPCLLTDADHRQSRRYHPAFLRCCNHHIAVPSIDRQVNRTEPAYGINQYKLVELFGNSADGLKAVGNSGGSLIMCHQHRLDSGISFQSLAHSIRVNRFAPFEIEVFYLCAISFSNFSKAVAEVTTGSSQDFVT